MNAGNQAVGIGQNSSDVDNPADHSEEIPPPNQIKFIGFGPIEFESELAQALRL